MTEMRYKVDLDGVITVYVSGNGLTPDAEIALDRKDAEGLRHLLAEALSDAYGE